MLNITFERIDELDENSKKIERYLKENYQADEETAYSVKLAIFEIAGNIIKHSKAKAQMAMSCEGDIIKLKFEGGKVFKISEISLPRQTCECGRGLYIVKHMCESLEYVDGGKQVCVSIKCKRGNSL